MSDRLHNTPLVDKLSDLADQPQGSTHPRYGETWAIVLEQAGLITRHPGAGLGGRTVDKLTGAGRELVAFAASIEGQERPPGAVEKWLEKPDAPPCEECRHHDADNDDCRLHPEGECDFGCDFEPRPAGTTEPDQPATDEPRVSLTTEQALAMLTSDSPHVLRQAGPMMIGADWPREQLEDLVRDGDCELAGPTAASMGHGLAVVLNGETYFIEASAADNTGGN